VVAVGSRARPRLLVLGAGPAQVGLLRAARERDLYVVAVDRDPAAPGFAYADKRALVSTEDEADVDRLARAEDVDAVVSPGADWTVGIAARVAHRLGLPHPLDPGTAALATSKARQRERFAAAGVPHARVLAEPAAPCVVKAPDRQGQRGLTLVRTEAELPAAIEAAVAASRTGGFLAEELVEGPEVTVNAFSVDGAFHPLAVTDRLTADPPAFGVALAHAWPSEACVGSTQAPVAAARAAAEALGIRNGPTYTQIVLADDGPRVIELAARLGGGHDAELVELATGVPVNALALESALAGRASVVPTQASGGVGGACVVFHVPPEGELRAIEGIEEARAVEGVADVRIYREPGHVFGPFRRGADRAGAVLATGASRDDALERARRAAGSIRFVVR
jgi:biotin carboxylase